MTTSEDAARIKRTLLVAGWHDAFEGYAEAGIEVSGFGEVALQYANEAEDTLLRLEFHSQGPDGVPEIHLHVTDESDVGPDFVMRFGDNLDALLATIIEVQDTLTLETINDGALGRILDACPRTYHLRDGRLRTIRPSPEASDAFQLGIEHAREARMEDAAVAFAKVLELCEDHEPAAQALVEVSRELGDHEAMLRAADVWCALAASDEPEPQLYRSIALQKCGRLADALGAVERALAIDDTDGTLHYQRACVLALSARTDEAIAAVTRALACDPDLVDEIDADDDLQSLRGNVAFDSLLSGN
jgi:tetratricopeptide (TPR) repeat protein